MPCPECPSGRLTHRTVPGLRYEFRARHYLVINADVLQCYRCGVVYATKKQNDILRRRAADLARKDMGLLTGADITAFRRRVYLSQAELEARLGVSSKTVARWEIGAVLQSRTVDTFLRLLMAHPELLSELPLPASSQSRRASSPRAAPQSAPALSAPALSTPQPPAAG